MFAFFIRRLVTLVPTLVFVSMLIFGLQQLLPGDPAQILAGEDQNPELIAQLSLHKLDLVLADEPVSKKIGVKAFNHPLGTSGMSFLCAPGLRTLLGSDETGPCLIEDAGHRALYVFNHFEYDSDTLKQEYDRDVANGTPINVPLNYYPDDDPAMPPLNRWRSHAHLLYGNWINEISQNTPYEIAEIGH